MANDTIKFRAIPAGGYQYQIEAGLLLLADWLDDPGLYKSVIFECEDPAVGMGLDVDPLELCRQGRAPFGNSG